ncbi:biliverdin-producing heme oxygenase [Ideonella sp. DXS29W]|uniref:Biliverdin-producing heme oxygenase n=1 Tax=Ideonella lacteola TaxID=2984193 RepID=A0ABU9BRX6_9BURK
MTHTANDASHTVLLSARLRLETRDLHQRAERAGLMAALLRGELARSAYAGLLFNLQAIYAALEAGLQRHDKRLTLIDFGPLYRGAALAADLQELGWADAPTAPLADATASYVSRLNALAEREPLLLLAHAYVRYLGDLHGGQILHRRISHTLALPEDRGARFYDFGPPGRVVALAQAFRAGLDAMQLTPVEADGLVAEARRAFQRHVELFEQLPH